MDLTLTKTFLVVQKKIRFDYSSDEEIMERRRTQTVVGLNPVAGEKSRGATSPTVTREEGPIKQPKFI